MRLLSFVPVLTAAAGISLCTLGSLSSVATAQGLLRDPTNKASMASAPRGVFQFSAPLFSGEPQALAQYRGHPLLIANVASRCGYTAGGYRDLAALAKTFAPRGLQILVFPCNQVSVSNGGTLRLS